MSSPRTRCNLLTSPQVYSCIWKEPGVSAQRRDAELFWRMELIVVHLFWLCYPQVSLGPVRLWPSSTLEFLWDLYPSSLRGNTEGGFCKSPASFSYRAGDLNRHLVVLRERRESKKEIHVAILSIAKHLFLGLHNEQGKTQEEYHSKEIRK